MLDDGIRAPRSGRIVSSSDLPSEWREFGVITRVVHLRDEPRRGESGLRGLIVDAALGRIAAHGLPSLGFAALCDAAGVSRATAYRLFPGGVSSLVEYLHVVTVVEVVSHMTAETELLPNEVSFTDAVLAGLRGCSVGLRSSPWTGVALRGQPDALTAYLLRRGQGSILELVVDFVSRCAAAFGAEGRSVPSESQQFAWGWLTGLLEPPSDVAWPDDSVRSSRTRQELHELGARWGIDGPPRSRLAVPIARIPTAGGPLPTVDPRS